MVLEVSMSTIKLPATLEALTQGTAFVAAQAVAAGFPAKRVTEIEVAIEEVLTNICHHAYCGGAGEVEVQCHVDEAQRLLIEVIDAGVPFNILSVAPPDVTSDLSARAVGGLGIFLLRKLVDEITYRRANDQNIVRLVVYRPS
jgi:serine/threonine-protein kinase RsbW